MFYSVKKAAQGETVKTEPAKVMQPLPAQPSTLITPPQKAEGKPWSVQIASFSGRKNAEKLTQKLMVIGQSELQPVLIDGKQWYRVYLHLSNSHMSQEQLLDELRKMGLRDAKIVK